MEQIRSFIAIELPDGLRLELSRLQAMLRQPDDRWVKWVNPQGIHLTLKFLGNIRADKISPVTGAIKPGDGQELSTSLFVLDLWR